MTPTSHIALHLSLVLVVMELVQEPPAWCFTWSAVSIYS